jgi:magnesium transporter
MGEGSGGGAAARRRDLRPAGPTEPFAVALRFEPTKEERRIEASEARAAIDDGWFVWVDLDLRTEGARALVDALGCVPAEVLEDVASGEPTTQVARYDACLHVALTACRMGEAGFELDRVDLVAGERWLVTLHRCAPHFLRRTRTRYRDDFVRFARSASFLLYEIWDHLIDEYLEVQKGFEERVERVQAGLTTEVDDAMFAKISALGSDLLHFRKVLLPARSVLIDLSTRRSPFISEATMPFLQNMVGTVDHVLQDLLVDRDILSESLSLYMSMVGHRTNRVMNRLTVVSVIFLPLTFLCGVYGMNFEVLPETKWEHGYLFFWVLVAVIVSVLLVAMRRKRLL